MDRTRYRLSAVWGSIACVVIGAFALRYAIVGVRAVNFLAYADRPLSWLSSRPTTIFREFAEAQLPRYVRLSSLVVGHAIGMGVAISIAPFALSSRVRQRRPRVHRALGYAYAIACVVGGLTGTAMAILLPMRGDAIAIAANVATGVMLATFTVLGIHAAIRRDLVQHERWMTRTFALLLTLPTLYAFIVILPIFSVPHAVAYEWGHYLCLPLNWLVCEWWLRGRDATMRWLWRMHS